MRQVNLYWHPFFMLWVCLSISGCSTGAPAVEAGSQLRIVSTVSPITNIIFNIGGNRIALTGIVPEGVNSHVFEPTPADAIALSQADIVFLNGLYLEDLVLEMAQANLKDGAKIVFLGDQTIKPDEYIFDFSFPAADGNPNPHLWMNPIYALRYAQIIRDALSRRDQANSDYYASNFQAFKQRIEELDKAIAQTIETIPEANRKLLTYHDSFAYFALRYDMIVIGAIQPSDFSEPSAQDVANLITQIRKENIPAIFGSEVFPSTVLEQIARETDAAYVDDLRDDDLPGEPGNPEHSYFGLMKIDVIIMAKALGGDPSLISNLDATNIPGSW